MSKHFGDLVTLEVIPTAISEKVIPPLPQICATCFKVECVFPCCCIFPFGVGSFAMEGMRRKQDSRRIHSIGDERVMGSASESASLSPGPVS